MTFNDMVQKQRIKNITKYDDEHDPSDELYSQAERSNDPIPILLEAYQKYEEHDDPYVDSIANDSEAVQWLRDYWDYVRDSEHGRQNTLNENGYFPGFAYIFKEPEQYIEYLIGYDDYDKVDDVPKELARRLEQLSAKYGGVVKMKKSQYNVGDYFVNDEGCKVQVTDLFRMDGDDMVEWTISYNSNGRAVTFTTMDVFEKMLSDKGARYGGNSSFEPIIREDEDLMQSTKKMKKSINIEQLAHDVTDLYEDIDPYTIRDAFDSMEEAYQSNLDALMTWNNDEIQRSIIDNLQEYADEGYTGIGSISVNDVISRLKELTSMKSTRKMKKSLFDIEDRFDELPDDLKDIARSLRSTLQVDDPVIDERDGDYYFIFSYYDGDPEYYFDELNIQQNNMEQYNYLNLSEVARNPPRWMKSTKKSIPSIHDMIAQTRANNNSLVKSRVNIRIAKTNVESVKEEIEDYFAPEFIWVKKIESKGDGATRIILTSNDEDEDLTEDMLEEVMRHVGLTITSASRNGEDWILLVE